MNGRAGQISVVLVDDDEFFRRRLKTLIDAQSDMRVVGLASSCEEALDVVCGEGASIVISEARFTGMGCPGLLDELRRRQAPVGLIVLTGCGRVENALRLVQAGAAAYLRKSGSAVEVLAAVRTVASGGRVLEPLALEAVLADYLARCQGPSVQNAVRLTRREREVVALIAEGRSTREIADDLGLSHKTVEVHRGRLMAKLGVHKVAHLVRYALREGLVGAADAEASPGSSFP